MDYRARHLQKYWISDFLSNTYERTKASCAVLLDNAKLRRSDAHSGEGLIPGMNSGPPTSNTAQPQHLRDSTGRQAYSFVSESTIYSVMKYPHNMLVYPRPHRRSFCIEDLGVSILRVPKRPQRSLLSSQLVGFCIHSLALPPALLLLLFEAWWCCRWW